MIKMTYDSIDDNNTLMQQAYPNYKWYIDLNNRTCFLFYQDNKIVGNFSIMETNDYCYIFNQLENLYVDSNYRRQYIGTYMMDELKIWCINNNKSEINLDINPTNLQAINFFKKNGFQIEETSINKVYMNLYFNSENIIKQYLELCCLL